MAQISGGETVDYQPVKRVNETFVVRQGDSELVKTINTLPSQYPTMTTFNARKTSLPPMKTKAIEMVATPESIRESPDPMTSHLSMRKETGSLTHRGRDYSPVQVLMDGDI